MLYDTPHGNPFREIVPLIRQHPGLLHIVVANAALHMKNSALAQISAECTRDSTDKSKPTPHAYAASGSALDNYAIAINSKHKALVSLNYELHRISIEHLEVVLAIILLFIEFDLIDSGRDEWRHHVRGARSLIEIVVRSPKERLSTMSSLRRCLITNCLLYAVVRTE